eukprot:s728_g33.t1
MKLWWIPKNRPLLGSEMLGLQGLMVNDLDPPVECSENLLGDMAGNAFLGLLLLAAHVLGALPLGPSFSGNSNKYQAAQCSDVLRFSAPAVMACMMVMLLSLQFESESEVDELAEISGRSEFSARHLSNLLWSAAHCGQEVFLTDLASELPRHLKECGSVRHGNTEVNRLLIPRKVSAIYLEDDNPMNRHWLAERMAQVLLERAKELKPLDLASILWSASCFASAFTPLIDALEPRLLPVASRLSARQLTNVAWAVATVASRKQRAVEMLVEEAIAAGASERDLPNLCWALAAVRGRVGGITETVQGLKQPPTLGMLWALSVTGAEGVSQGDYDTLLLDPDDSRQRMTLK